MKKLFLTTLLLISYGVVYTLPIGNPREASLYTQGIFLKGSKCEPIDPCFYWFDAWSLRVGYYGDFVFNRNLAIDGEGFGEGEDIAKTQIFTNAGYLVLNIADKLDIFGTLGAARIEIETNDISWGGPGALSIVEWETRFSWSAGARATLFTRNNLTLGVEGQYFQTDPDLTTFVDQGFFNSLNLNNKTRYQEWQVGTGIAYRINCFCSNWNLIPYGGVKWAWSRLRTNNLTFSAIDSDDVTILNLKAKKLWGYGIGITSVYCDKVGLTVEGRWADEKALYINGDFRF